MDISRDPGQSLVLMGKERVRVVCECALCCTTLDIDYRWNRITNTLILEVQPCEACEGIEEEAEKVKAIRSFDEMANRILQDELDKPRPGEQS